MSGALAERVFAEKLERAGFANVWVGGHRSFGIEDAALMPLFTSEVIELMRRTISGDQQDRVATAVIIKASKPNGDEVEDSRTTSTPVIAGPDTDC